MKLRWVLSLTLLLFVDYAKGLENLMGSEIQKCLNCLCHARSGCWSRFNCAKYSIDIEYWRHAGSHSLQPYDNEDAAYKSCIQNENCILNTIKSYTESFGEKDCNCDGHFDCKDRLAIHLFGSSCFNPQFGSTYATRFNHCAKEIDVRFMSEVEGDCSVEVF